MEDAFFNYLTKLDEMARLEVVTMYMEEFPSAPTSNTLHVIGRTHNDPHKYFYRTYVQGRWSAWEPVDADIEDDHVAAVVWRDRLYLFWLTFMEKGVEPGGGGTPAKKIKDSAEDDLETAPKREVLIHLNWVERVQGQWSTKKSGGIKDPLKQDIGKPFDRRDISIHITTERLTDDKEGAVQIWIRRLSEANSQFDAFILRGRNASPQSVITPPGQTEPQFPPFTKNAQGALLQPYASRRSGIGNLNVMFESNIIARNGEAETDNEDPKVVLGNGGRFTIATHTSGTRTAPNDWRAQFITPFFYQDDTHSFFVLPSLPNPTFEDGKEYITVNDEPARKPVIDKVKAANPYRDKWMLDDPKASKRPSKEEDWLMDERTVLRFDDHLIHELGAIAKVEMVAMGKAGTNVITAQPGAISIKTDAMGAFEEGQPSVFASSLSAGGASANAISIAGSTMRVNLDSLG